MDFAKNYSTSIMSMKKFKVGLLEAHRIPGLLIKSDENGCILIGIQFDEDQVVKVATTSVDKIAEKVDYWKDKIPEIQTEYQLKAN